MTRRLNNCCCRMGGAGLQACIATAKSAALPVLGRGPHPGNYFRRDNFTLQQQHGQSIVSREACAAGRARCRVASLQIRMRHHPLRTILRHRRSARRHRMEGSCQSVVVECKISRSDFLADANKPFRQNPEDGLASRRFYMVPAGILAREDLPKYWGLLECKGRRCT